MVAGYFSIDSEEFKIEIPCSAGFKKLIVSGRLIIPENIEKIRQNLKKIRLFDNITYLDNIKAFQFDLGDRKIYIFKTGNVRATGFKDKDEAKIMVNFLLSVLFFASVGFDKETLELIREYELKIGKIRDSYKKLVGYLREIEDRAGCV